MSQILKSYTMTPFFNFIFLLFIGLVIQTESRITPPPLPNIERCTFTNSHELRRNKDCQVYLHTGKYCDSNDQICKNKITVPFRPATAADGVITANEICTSGFHPGEKNGNTVREMPDGRTTSRCFALAGWGCVINEDSRSTTVCVDHRSIEATTNKCTKEETTTPTNLIYSKIGGECGIVRDGKNYLCGYNLNCNANRVCVRAAGLDEACDTTSTNVVNCLSGLTCMNKRCIRKYSLNYGESCELGHHIACASGYCNDAGICGLTLTNSQCSKDADCVPSTTLTSTGSPNGNIHLQLDRTHSVCFIEMPIDYAKLGKCSAVYQPAAHDLEKCLFERCGLGEGERGLNGACTSTPSSTNNLVATVGTNHPCTKEWVRRTCAQYCVQPVDRRYTTQPYIFNCESLTATFMSSSYCSVTQQFQNCMAIHDYPSSGSIVVVRTILVFIVVLATLFFLF